MRIGARSTVRKRKSESSRVVVVLSKSNSITNIDLNLKGNPMNLDKIIVLVFVAIGAIGLLVLRHNSQHRKQQSSGEDPQQSS